MPFDNTPLETTITRRSRLIAALRQPMPPRFRWNFGIVRKRDPENCGTSGCALGLAVEIGIIPPTHRDTWKETIAASIGISQRQAEKIFFPNRITVLFRYHVLGFSRVIPAMVANKLEQLGA